MTVEVTGGASTTSRLPSRMLTGLRSVATDGCRVTLEDGRAHVDWEMGLIGPIFSYRPDWWVRAVVDAAHRVSANSFGCADERVAAEMLADFYPDVEAVRWMCNGSDSCAAAAKLARAITGRDRLLVFGYHGTASAYATPPEVNARPNMPAIDMRRGTLQAERDALVPLSWLDNMPVIDEVWPVSWDEIAAVIVECPPVDDVWNGTPSNPSVWLKRLTEKAHSHDALFVLDEVVTGFRYGPGGAAEYYGLQGLVDLYCFGKTLGNGYPVAALAGRRAIMDELTRGVHFSGTHFGEPLGMAVAKAFLRQLREQPPWDHLHSIGAYLMEKWNALGLPWRLVGHPTRPVLKPGGLPELDDLRRWLMTRGHVVVDHPWFLSTAHRREDVDDLVAEAAEWKEVRACGSF